MNQLPAVFGRIGEVGGVSEEEALGLEKFTDLWLFSLSNSCSLGRLEIRLPLVGVKPVLSTLTPRPPRGGVGEVTRCTGGSTLAERRGVALELEGTCGTGGASAAAGTGALRSLEGDLPGEEDLNVRSVMEPELSRLSRPSLAG